MTRVDSEQNAELIKEGKIGVIPTDTIYGIVCSALNEVTVERLYKVRGRDARKPCIVLISDAAELAQFGIVVDGALEKALSRVWPGAVSVILDCPSDTFEYLHRGTKTLAFRLPKDEWLQKFLALSGPLLAPSANPEGKPPAKTLDEARRYFGETVDFYIDGGECDNGASTLVRYENGRFITLRQGHVSVKG